MCSSASPGDRGFVDGVEYEAVDNNLIRVRISERVDATKLCTSLVTDMNNLFSGEGANYNIFNQRIGNWDVSNVTNMKRMFLYSEFNQPIGNWDVSSVTDMSYMFTGSPFNKSISNRLNNYFV